MRNYMCIRWLINESCLKIAVNGIPNRLKFSVIFKVYKYTENVAAGT